MEAGSVQVFIKLPALTAFQLKTLALNRDNRFKQLGITSLRLAGDQKFINIALGLLTITATLTLGQAFWLRIPALFSSTFGFVIGKLITILAALIAITIFISTQGFSNQPRPGTCLNFLKHRCYL